MTIFSLTLPSLSVLTVRWTKPPRRVPSRAGAAEGVGEGAGWPDLRSDHTTTPETAAITARRPPRTIRVVRGFMRAAAPRRCVALESLTHLSVPAGRAVNVTPLTRALAPPPR